MSTVKVQQHGKVSVISINRPERRNALCKDTVLELQAAFADFDASEQRVAILTGEGDEAFCAGADLDNAQEMWRELWRCVPTVGITTEKPIIAATAGWCVGAGLVLVAMCDLAIAADNTKFMYPEAKVGLFGGFIVGLTARIPHKIAMEMIMLGRTVDARRAYEIGLVNRVVPKGQQVEEGVAMAEEMGGYAPLVLRTMKRFVTQHILPKGPSEQMGALIRNLEIVNLSEDCKEGVAAFKEKRAPAFIGR
jgi:enoyl-CoA hydratase